MLHLVIGGASIEVSVHDDSWLGAIVGLSGAPTGRSAGRIECGGAVTAPPDALPDFADGDARGWTERPVPHLVMGAAHVSLGEGVVAITAPPDRGLEAFDRALPLTLTWLLGAVDLWVLHAAAVIGSDGLALVATSPGGGGKSTVALAASAGGWPVLADDLVVVRLRPGPAGGGPGSLEVCGVPRPLAVPSEFSDFGPPIPGDVRCRRRVSAPLQGGWWPVGRMAVLAHGTEPAGRGDRRAASGDRRIPGHTDRSLRGRRTRPDAGVVSCGRTTGPPPGAAHRPWLRPRHPAPDDLSGPGSGRGTHRHWDPADASLSVTFPRARHSVAAWWARSRRTERPVP